MFKSKTSNSHHQWQQHDISSSLMSPGCSTAAQNTSVPACEERTPERKPRWNPKPEQIRVLEAIFNSGMVHPPRDEIRKIRAQLQEYGQVGDANVFYWFQNKKSRTKQKLRNLQNSKKQSHTQTRQQAVSPISGGSSSSSSSSGKSTSKGSNKSFTISASSLAMDTSNSPTGSVNQTFFHAQGKFLEEPFFPVQQTTGTVGLTQGLCFSDLSDLVHQVPEQIVGPCTSLLLSELVIDHGVFSKKKQEGKMIKNIDQQFDKYCYTNIVPPITSTVSIPSTINQYQGICEISKDHQMDLPARLMVFINDVAIEMTMAPFNIRQVFGDDAMLLHSSGQPVLTDEFGVTIQPLQHGASYDLVMH